MSIGALLNESHVSMRDDFEISIEELDCAVEVAQANGAVGSRMTGGGFGGAAIALVPIDESEQIANAIRDEFAKRNYAAPNIFAVNADDGARREN
jgi:galactokinase